MAPAANKRRRGEEEVRRPKKRIKNFKKQAEYHSSSDEDDAPASAGVAPRRPIPSATGANATKPTKAKPILKHAIEEQEAPQEPKKVPRDELEMQLAEEDESRDLPEEEPVPEVDDEEEDVEDLEDETAKNTVLNMAPAETSASEDDDDEEDADEDDLLDDNDEPTLASESSASDSDSSTSATSSNPQRSKKKRNDPTAFATSISKLLDTKLTTSKRADPVLSRSKTAAEANTALANERLETKARAQIRHERKSMLEKGRVKDVLGLETEGVETGSVVEEEKRLKKTAQRGVVKLFNAVRAAQVKAEVAGREARREGVVGIGKREERVSEMSKQGFLDLISSGGKKGEVTA